MSKLYKLYFSIKRWIISPNWVNLRTVHPVSKTFGLDRGTPIDRFYIDYFIKNSDKYISGNVLEVDENSYTLKYASDNFNSSILKYSKSNLGLNFLNGDLSDLSTLPENSFDCFICTQTFNFIFDYRSAIHGARYLLKDNGVLIATVAGLCQIFK